MNRDQFSACDSASTSAMSSFPSTDQAARERYVWLAAKQLFQEVIALPISQRDDFINCHCSDSAVAAQVRQLLSWHEGKSNFLTPLASPEYAEHSLDDSVDTFDGSTAEELTGRQIGGFVLGSVIGQGSMGTVYEAQQVDPPRPAAFKILRGDALFFGIGRRLAQEACLLARLDHPGIARILSAGTIESNNLSRPWFAMELIQGPTLLEYAQRSNLDLRRKLELFIRLCDAVQHAHQRNVIHRDLKPDNILVRTLEAQDLAGGCGQPVVLDFGVARLANTNRLSSHITAAGLLIGTLAYMSPEQLSGNPDLIDARSDVYALGVIGYELLSGKTPHDRQGSSIIEVLQRIANERCKSLGELDGSLRGELDAIFGKAIDSDVNRRYQSVFEFSQDIRAYLNHQPVRARPATYTYRLQKFVRRNRIIVGGLATTFLAMALGLFAYSQEAKRARLAEQEARRSASNAQYEADKAKAVNEFLTNDFMLRLLESVHASSDSTRISTVDLAGKAASNVATMFKGKPTLEAAVRNELGTIYYNLHQANAAAEQFELALRLWSDALGSDHVDTLKAVNNLGQTRMLQGRTEDAEALYRSALAGRLAAFGEHHVATAATLNNLAEAVRAKGDLSEAEAHQKRALEILMQVLGEQHGDTVTAMANYGSTLVQKGNTEEGLKWHHRAYEASRTVLGDNHVITLHTGLRLAQTLLATNDRQQSYDLLLMVLKGYENIYGTESIETVSPRRLLARVHKALGDQDSAEQHLRTALNIAKSKGDQGRALVDRITRELNAIK